MRKILALAAAFVIASALAAPAAGPGDTPPGAPGVPPRTVPRSGFSGASETTITGMVVDGKGQPLLDVAVKLYMGGLLVSEVPTSSMGEFELTELIDYGNDVTIDLWFIPPTEDLVMENVILKESTAAAQYELYSKCVKRVRLGPITDIIVTLHDLEKRTEVLKRSDCID